MISAFKKTCSLLFLFSLLHTSLKAQYKVSEIVDRGKIKITEPYFYDGFVLTQFTLDNKIKFMQTQFAALKGQQYKLYFCTSDFDEGLTVSIKSDKSEPNLIDLKANVNCVAFEITKSGNYIIEYKVPLAENAEYGNTKKECVVMLISYKSK